MRVQKTEMQGLVGEEELVGMGSWFVAEDYQYELDGRIHPVGRASGFRAPLDDPHLFLGFARLGAGGGPDKETILKWVRKHGLLRRQDYGRERSLADGTVNHKPMTFEEFREEVRYAYQALTLFEQIRSKDYDKLRDRFELERRVVQAEVITPHPGGVRDPEISWKRLRRTFVSFDSVLVPRAGGSWTDLTDEELLEQAVSTLQHLVEQRMSRIGLSFTQHVHHPRSLSTIAGYLPFRPRLTWRCPDLESALWFHFASLITDKRPWLICEGCGQFFLQARPNKLVCDATCRKRKERKGKSEKDASGQ